ncbi:hypothetical protein [Sinomicrobium sp. M5D2P17]
MVENYFRYNCQSINNEETHAPDVSGSGLFYTCLVLSLNYNLPSFLIEKYTNRHILSGIGPEGVIADGVWWDTADKESGSPVALCDFRKRVRK